MRKTFTIQDLSLIRSAITFAILSGECDQPVVEAFKILLVKVDDKLSTRFK